MISHRTRTPYRGEKYDLHRAAREWLERWKIPKKNAFFEETKEKKVARILQQQCTHFIDDLPEFLKEIPDKLVRILFGEGEFLSFSEWKDLPKILNFSDARQGRFRQSLPS